jgi:AbrB family looped-hinge helix DNA binding protein
MAGKVKVKKSTEAVHPRIRRGRTSSSRISSKNQITIPVGILREAGIGAGDTLEFRAIGGKVEIIPTKSKILELAGKWTEYFDGFDLEKDRRKSWREFS